MLMSMGVKHENILMLDSKGVVHKKRNDLSAEKAEFAQDTPKRSVLEAMEGCDLFLGVSGPGLLTKEMVQQMAPNPIIFALANPVPEIMPEVAREAAPNALIATGRSDYPNQVNNVLCFPFIFRGALDVGATEINEAMKLACVEAIASIARATTSAEVGAAYQGEKLAFGPDYLIPKPFDPRLLPVIAHAVAKAAMESGVAKRPIDLDAYKAGLEAQVFRTRLVMRPVFAAARAANRRIVFAEGEDERVLRTTQALIEDGVDTPILIGRPNVVEQRLERLGLSIRAGDHFQLVNPQRDNRYHDYWTTYHELMEREGVTTDTARTIMRTNNTAIAAVMVHRGEADSMICGTMGQYLWHLNYTRQVLARDGLEPQGAMSLILLDQGPLFIADTHINAEPTPEQVAKTVIAAARHVRRFGIVPQIAVCSSSQFGNLDSHSGRVMRGAMAILDAEPRDFVYEGEMQTDAALNPEIRLRLFPRSRMTEPANVLIYANSDAAGATRNLMKSIGNGLEVGPILMGMGNRAHIVTPAITVRGLINVAALAGTEVASYG
jgi:malate dehydrogenase (oxaloacetate-decarboxylating)(NADP+)